MKKLRVWESKPLEDKLVLVTEIGSGIIDLAKKTEVVSLNDLPPSLIPTSTLYEVCVCYEMMYNRLLEYDLLDTGNIKSTTSLN